MPEAGVDTHKEHWERVYAAQDEAFSWRQDEPTVSLRLIKACSPDASERVIDVGGGSSKLVDHLLAMGYRTVGVNDLSNEALRRTKERLGDRANMVCWIPGDITRITSLGTYDIWHDRAVFHFLTTPDERARYKALAASTLPAGGHLVIATFALDGPERCSGLSVNRYSPQTLSREFEPEFRLVHSEKETHLTPGGVEQSFVYCVLQKQ